MEDLIEALGASGDESVPGADGQPKPLREALFRDYAITFAEKKFVEAAAQKGAAQLADLLAPENADGARHVEKAMIDRRNDCCEPQKNRYKIGGRGHGAEDNR